MSESYAQILEREIRLTLQRSFVHKPNTEDLRQVIKEQLSELLAKHADKFDSGIPTPKVKVTVDGGMATITLQHAISQEEIIIPDWLRQLLGNKDD